MIGFFILIVTFLFSSAGLFSLIPNFFGVPKVYLFDVFALLFVYVSIIYLLSSKKKIEIPGYQIIFFVFLLYAFITLVIGSTKLNFQQALTSALYILRVFIYFGVGFVIYNLGKTDKKFKIAVTKILLFSSVFVCVAGVIQLFVFPNLSDLPQEYGWDPHINRLVSTFFDPNFTGIYIVLGLILTLGMIFDKSKKSIFIYIILVIQSISLILTFSRSSWLSFAVSILIFGVFKSKKLIIVTFLIMFLTYYLVPRAQTRLSGVTDPADSARLRISSWQIALSISKDNLLTGVGFNSYRYAQERYGFFDYSDEDNGGHAGSGSDSSLLLVLATTGVIGLLIFLLTYKEILINSFRTYKSSDDLMSLVLFTSTIALLVHSQFVNSLFYPQVMLWFWALSGVSYNLKAS